MGIRQVTRVESQGFYRGYNRWIAVAVKIIIMLLVLWASIAADAADILLGIKRHHRPLRHLVHRRHSGVYGTSVFWRSSQSPANSGSERGCRARIWPLRLVLNDVWRRHRRRHVDLLNRRTALSLRQQPRRHHGARRGPHPRKRPIRLQVDATPLRPHTLGVLRRRSLSLAYFSYRKGMPLTIRSPFSALLGHRLGTLAGGLVDTAAILATVIGIAVTIGYGVSQLAYGFHQIAEWDWLLKEGQPSIIALTPAVFIIIVASMLSALSGIGRGIKWLSNLNMVLSWLLLRYSSSSAQPCSPEKPSSTALATT